MAALTLSRLVWETLLEEARRSLPNECCGLLGGRGDQVVQVYPATNELASPVAYEIPARELFALFRRLRAEKLELVGLYHSHPTGDNAPSARDRERAYYPDAAYVIVTPRADAPHPVRAFLLQTGTVCELSVDVVD